MLFWMQPVARQGAAALTLCSVHLPLFPVCWPRDQAGCCGSTNSLLTCSLCSSSPLQASTQCLGR